MRIMVATAFHYRLIGQFKYFSKLSGVRISSLREPVPPGRYRKSPDTAARIRLHFPAHGHNAFQVIDIPLEVMFKAELDAAPREASTTRSLL